MKALTAGKHVLCEKPLTMSAADSVALYETARGVGRHLSEAFMWPHHPRAQRLRRPRRRRATSARSSPTSAVFTFALDRPNDHRLDARGGGALLDGGIYCLGPALCLTDVEPATVAARAARNARRRRRVDGRLGRRSATCGASFTVSLAAPGRRHQTVIGRDGLVVDRQPLPRTGAPRHADRRAPGRLPRRGRPRRRQRLRAHGHRRSRPRPPATSRPAGPPTQSIRLATVVDALHAATTRLLTPLRSRWRPTELRQKRWRRRPTVGHGLVAGTAAGARRRAAR